MAQRYVCGARDWTHVPCFQKQKSKNSVDVLKDVNMSCGYPWPLASYISRGLRWVIILKGLGLKRGNQTPYAVSIGYFTNTPYPEPAKLLDASFNQTETFYK